MLGFAGLGYMGTPMALNLVKAGIPLTVWNRTPEKTEALAQAGAKVAATPAELFARCETILLMLVNDDAVDAVLGSANVAGRLIVNMGTTSPSYSQVLAKKIEAAGGRYAEAPVSGSRKPAEAGQLIGMLAGAEPDLAALRPVLAPLCRDTVTCGPVPQAMAMKLAVNLFLIATVTGLAEAVHFAAPHGLDLGQVMAVINAGQMASDVSRLKGPKLVERDFSAHATITDVAKNSRLIAEAARRARVAVPLLFASDELYRETAALGYGTADMAAVLLALEARAAMIAG